VPERITYLLTAYYLTTPLAMQASIFGACPQARMKWEGCGRKGIRRKNVWMMIDGGGSVMSPDGVAVSRIVCMSASVIFPCTIKSKRFLLVPTHPGSPGKKAVRWLCVLLLWYLSNNVGWMSRRVSYLKKKLFHQS